MEEKRDTEKRLSDLEEKISKLQLGVNKKKEKKPRAPTEYNNFIKKYIEDQRAKLGSDYEHKKVFKLAAESWKKKSTEKP